MLEEDKKDEYCKGTDVKARRTERNSVGVEHKMKKRERADVRGMEASTYTVNSLRTGDILYLPHLILWQQSQSILH